MTWRFRTASVPPLFIGFEFNQSGVCNIWKSSVQEFPDLASAGSANLSDQIYEYFLDNGKGHAEQIADSLGSKRDYVSRILNNDTRFTQIGLSRPQYYGLKEVRRQENS